MNEAIQQVIQLQYMNNSWDAPSSETFDYQFPHLISQPALSSVTTTTSPSLWKMIRDSLTSVKFRFAPPFISTTFQDKVHHVAANTIIYDIAPLNNPSSPFVIVVNEEIFCFETIITPPSLTQKIFSGLNSPQEHHVKSHFCIDITTLPEDYTLAYYSLYLLAASSLTILALVSYFKRKLTQGEAQATELRRVRQAQLKKSKKSFQEPEKKLLAFDTPHPLDPKNKMKKIYTDDVSPPNEPSQSPKKKVSTSVNPVKKNGDQVSKQQQQKSVDNEQPTHSKVSQKVNATTIKEDKPEEQRRLEQIIFEKERLEKQILEVEKLQKRKEAEKQILEIQVLKQERLERQRLETHREQVKYTMLKEKVDQLKLENQQLEEKLMQQALEKKLMEQTRLEKLRLDKEKFVKGRLETQKLEKERYEQKRLQEERFEKELLDKIKLEKEKLLQEIDDMFSSFIVESKQEEVLNQQDLNKQRQIDNSMEQVVEEKIDSQELVIETNEEQVGDIPVQEDQVPVVEEQKGIENLEEQKNEVDVNTQYKRKLHNLENRTSSLIEEIQGQKRKEEEQIVKRELDAEKAKKEIAKAEQERKEEMVLLAKSLISLNDAGTSLMERRKNTVLPLCQQIINDVNMRVLQNTVEYHQQCYTLKKAELMRLAAEKAEIKNIEAFKKKQLTEAASRTIKRRRGGHQDEHGFTYKQNKAELLERQRAEKIAEQLEAHRLNIIDSEARYLKSFNRAMHVLSIEKETRLKELKF